MTDCRDSDAALPLVVASQNEIKIVADMTLILEPGVGYKYASEIDMTTGQGFIILEDGQAEFRHGAVRLQMEEIEARRIATLITDRYDAGN